MRIETRCQTSLHNEVKVKLNISNRITISGIYKKVASGLKLHNLGDLISINRIEFID